MSTEKTLANEIKKALPKNSFFQKIENRVSSGFPDLFILLNGIPLFIELKSPIKGNRIKLEKSQVSTHLRINKNNYISFILKNDPRTSNAFLFDGYSVANAIVLGQEEPCFVFHGSIAQCIANCNSLAQRKMSIASFSL